jgi:hypothetical protein
MGGGLMQLVAMGAQDVYLTGNPQITFFKVVYRRHTNFSKEAIAQQWNGAGDTKTCTLSRNGDLVQEIYLTAASGQTLALDEVASVEVEIGGQKIDKHYNTWLDIYDELFEENRDLKAALAAANGFVPLRFWFNRNPGLALPLIALQYHEVKIVAEFTSSNGSSNSANCGGLLVNYLYLDTDERRRFAQVSHEYLIEQVQHTGGESIANTDQQKSVTLTFNHPVKALFWKGMAKDYKAKIQLNGHDRAAVQSHLYYTGVQPYECGLRHVGNVNNRVTNTATTPAATDVVGAFALNNAHAGMYSFCLKPAEHQPSGTCNFSRIDNARLVFSDMDNSSGAGTLEIFALNYNVLRIMSGMGGLAYSN